MNNDIFIQHPKGFILRNSARCKKCGDVLVSRYRHDFVKCSCKAIYIDGGHDYLRGGGEREACDSTSIIVTGDTPFDVVRDNLEWGTYGKDGDEELHYILLKDMTTDHLKAILETQTKMSEFYKWAMMEELKRRGENYGAN